MCSSTESHLDHEVIFVLFEKPSKGIKMVNTSKYKQSSIRKQGLFDVPGIPAAAFQDVKGPLKPNPFICCLGTCQEAPPCERLAAL